MRKSILLSLILFSFSPLFVAVIAQTQAGMVNKSGGGQYFDAEKYKIDRMKAQGNTPPPQAKHESPTEFKEPKKSPNAKGEIWIDGYCRFRPAGTNRSHYKNESELSYLRPVYPKDTIRLYDNFGGKGNIDWEKYKNKDGECSNVVELVKNNLADGIPVPVFEKLLYCAPVFTSDPDAYLYEFSRGVRLWIKRVSGSEKLPIEFSTQYNYTNGDDKTVVSINDRGEYDLTDRCNNCKSTKNKLKSGRIKSWTEGGWNELAISKDEFNTVRFMVNDELIYQYQQPDIPISTRFASFDINLPYEWEKKKLMYHIGHISVESYPKSK
ncbi:MAG: hypothetical protein JWP69_2261 [Flaviaesturariibacter sp.]|nr:hypothetical protein [Flaviaesturariibacter sp.]